MPEAAAVPVSYHCCRTDNHLHRDFLSSFGKAAVVKSLLRRVLIPYNMSPRGGLHQAAPTRSLPVPDPLLCLLHVDDVAAGVRVPSDKTALPLTPRMILWSWLPPLVHHTARLAALNLTLHLSQHLQSTHPFALFMCSWPVCMTISTS